LCQLILDEPLKKKYAVSIGKGILGAIPIVGPLIAETVGSIIPNQRIDRINDFLLKLEEKIKDIDQEQTKLRFKSEEFIDILEEGMLQAAKSLTKERKEYIASLVANGIKDEDIEHVQKKLILNLLNELNDAEIIILQSYGLPPGEEKEFFEQHKEILMPPPPALRNQDPSLIDDRTLFDAQKSHLARLNLITPTYKKTKKGELPEFDPKTGMIKAQGYKITPLGRLLLKNIDLRTW